jgi:ribosome-associated toxin RatA of RatAB toxin-antitoxin module
MSMGMELVMDYEFLNDLNDEVVIKEVRLVSDNVVQAFHFKIP